MQRRSNEAVLEVITHCEEAMDGIAPIPLANKSAPNSIGTLVDAQEIVQRSEHTCVSSAWSLTVPWNVRGILGGGHHPKVRERGSTRVRGQCCGHPGRGVKRQHDTILKSASSEKVSVVGCSPREVPLESAGKEGVSPSVEVPILVRGTLLEVADHRTSLLQEVLRQGLEVHQLSGVVDVARIEPFDDVKVVVKRGEVDWLHVVPSASWSGRMGTRLTKLCKIAPRKGIWWSVHILPSSLESGCEFEKLLQLEGARQASTPLGDSDHKFSVFTLSPSGPNKTRNCLAQSGRTPFTRQPGRLSWCCWPFAIL